MSLEIGSNQQRLHDTSRAIVQHTKIGTTYYGRDIFKYTTTSSQELQPKIPSPDIFENLTSVPQERNPLPTTAECAIHLEFLAVLRELRERVIKSKELDGIFDIQPINQIVTRRGRRVNLGDPTFKTRREVKWDKFLDFAVVRFLAWWEKVPDMVSSENGESYHWEAKTLPPLDILMVWHSFLLNPRWFRQSCVDEKKLHYNIDFPWAEIHSRIISNDWSFSLSDSQAATFLKETCLKPDLLENLLEWKSYGKTLCKSLTAKTAVVNLVAEVDKIRDELENTDQCLLQHFIDAPTDPVTKLKDAILRQVSFVNKMWDRMWIRSPALDGTLQRAGDRYSKFLKLFKLYPTKMFVPTLDIDLVWHTHQCSPLRYCMITQEVAGKFVNHDDSIVQSELDTALTDTRAMYRMRFGQEYLVCGCWDCETLQSAVEGLGKDVVWEDVAAKVSDDVAYYRAVEVARRKKGRIPIR